MVKGVISHHLSSAENGISILSMMVRFENRIARLLVVFAMALSVVLFAFSGPASDHAPSLHQSASAEPSSVLHDHDDTGHTHAASAGVSSDQGPAAHHHGDHTHEKAGFPTVADISFYRRAETVFMRPVRNLADGNPGGIDRPPRSVFGI